MTDLDDTTIVQVPRLLRGPAARTVGTSPAHQTPATTGDEIWSAVSTDHRWIYDRTEETTTPWECTYAPTGQTVVFGTLDAARRWTARDEGRFALAELRAHALRVTERGASSVVLMFNPGTPETTRAAARAREAEQARTRVAYARRHLAVLDGLLTDGTPEHRCTGKDCGGYLTVVHAGDRAAWVHADACRECVDLPPAERRRCRTLDRHVPCGDADPVLCGHVWCSLPAAAPELVGQCPHGRDACCGCCEYDE